MNKKLKGAMSIVERLRDRGFQAFFVGGYVRSMVMNRVEPDDDIDIATNAVPDQIKGMFRNVIGVGEHFGVVLVIINGISYEVATFRSDSGTYDGRHPQGVEFGSIEADAERRDFTVNSLYYDPVNRRVLDYTGGREDIQRGVLRAIGDPEQRFREDYLRLLRGIRFSARLSFRVEEKTYQAAKRNAAGIRSVSSERIFQEVTKILTGPDPGFGVRLLSETGLCRYVLPEVEKMKGIEQPPEFHPEGDV
ncbi:MAG: CCA tRNA nucleotidyltransferase [Chitinivibrionales bacterium]